MDQTIDQKHQELMASINRMPDSWAFLDKWPPAPDVGIHSGAFLPLKKYLRKGITGELHYILRSPEDEDVALFDDYFTLTFNPEKQDYDYLVHHAFADFVLAFRAYRAQILDGRFYGVDYEQKRLVNDRHGVFRIFPVAYYDRELCRRAFSLTPEEIVDRLFAVVESVRLLGDGVLLVVRSQVISFEEMAAIDTQIRSLLIH